MSTTAEAASRGRLKPTLGYSELVFYGLAYIAPIAPLSTLGFVWDASNGLIVLAYLLGALCMYFTAQSYATMTGEVANAGSVYGFARHCLGPYAGFIAGWMILLDYLLIPALVYVLMSVALEQLIPGIDRGVWICLLVAASLAVNWFGLTLAARVNLASVVIQLAVVIIFIGASLFALNAGHGTGGLTLRPVWNASTFEPIKVFSATAICINSFLGFDAISTLAEEVKGGDRKLLGRAILHVLIIAATLFVVTTFVIGNVMVGFVMHDPAAAAYDLATVAVGPWLAVLVAWTYALVVGTTNALPMQVGVARVLFAMGRDRQLPHILSRVHPKYHTPYVGMLATSAVSLIVALSMRNALDELASLVNFGALSGFLLLHVSVFVYFSVKQRSRRYFLHVVVPWLGALVVAAVFTGMSALAVRVGLAWLVFGLVYGALLARRRRMALDLSA